MKVSIAVAAGCLLAFMQGAASARDAEHEHEQAHEQAQDHQHSSAGGADGSTSPEDCRRVDLAVERTYLASQLAWGWDQDALHASGAVMPRYLGKAEYFARQDAKALDAFLAKPGIVLDPDTRQQVDCRRVQSNARVTRDVYTDVINRLASARASCDTPVEVLDGRCGKVAGQALEAGDRLRAGAVSALERESRESPGVCKRALVVPADLSTPPCGRMTEFGLLCRSLHEDEARALLAGAAAELKKLQGDQAKITAQAALVAVNGAIAAFDRFSGGGRSDDKLLLTASVQAAHAHEVVNTGVARGLCSPSGGHAAATPAATPSNAHQESHDAHQTNWRKHLRVHRH